MQSQYAEDPLESPGLRPMCTKVRYHQQSHASLKRWRSTYGQGFRSHDILYCKVLTQRDQDCLLKVCCARGCGGWKRRHYTHVITAKHIYLPGTPTLHLNILVCRKAGLRWRRTPAAPMNACPPFRPEKCKVVASKSCRKVQNPDMQTILESVE
jgi:hypothetical protein